ncbi:MAG: hypothetical protein WBG32_02070 [Nodosilinea sp.]
MNNINWTMAGSLTVAIAAIGIFPVSPAGLAQTSTQPVSVYELISEFFGGSAHGGRGKDSSSRGDDPLCLINPGTDEMVWTLQPMIVVHGNVETIGLRPIDLDDEFDSVHMAYGGEPLEPGESYEWIVYQRDLYGKLVEDLKVPFQVMAAGDGRDRITTELEQLQAVAEADQLSIDEAIQAQIDFLLAEGLAADAIQVLFSPEAAGETLEADRQALIAEICPEPEPEPE